MLFLSQEHNHNKFEIRVKLFIIFDCSALFGSPAELLLCLPIHFNLLLRWSQAHTRSPPASSAVNYLLGLIVHVRRITMNHYCWANSIVRYLIKAIRFISMHQLWGQPQAER